MKRLIVAACALAAGLGLAAAPAVSAPAAKPAAKAGTGQAAIPRLNYRHRQLANGLRVYSMRDPASPSVTVQMWYDVGAKDDPEGRSGFAHLFEHILSRKTVNMPLGTMNGLTEDIGGVRNASTGQDFTNYFETVPANYLETMLWTHAERMARPVVDEQVFKAEREIVKEEMRQRVLAPPYGRLQRFVINDNAFTNHPYRRPGIGSVENLNAATIEDARNFHEAYYRPDTAVLIVSGNFDQAQLDAWVDKYFAGIERPNRPVVHYKPAPEPAAKARSVVAYAPNVPLPAVAFSWSVPRTNHPDTAPLTVLDAILSRGESSRLYKALVYDRALASSVQTLGNTLEEGGNYAPIVIAASGVAPETLETAMAAEVARLRDAPVTAAELIEARNELVADELRSRETASGRAFLLGQAITGANDADWADKQIAAIQQVTAADVQRVARKYLTDETRLTVRYLDESQRPAGQADAWRNPAPMPKFLTVAAATRAPNELAPEGKRQAPPAPGAPRAIAAPAVAERILPNGLRVIVARSSDVPLATAQLYLPGGSVTDPAGRTGLSTFTADLATQGTRTRTAPQIAAAVEALGANLGGGAGPDGTFMSISSPVSALDPALGILADVVINPVYAPAELERRRKQTLDGLAVAMKNPASLAQMSLTRLGYGSAPYGAGQPTEASVKAISRDDLVRHHAAWWRPQGATLVIAGGVDAEKTFALVEKTFGSWKGEGAAPALPVSRAGPSLPPRVVVIDLPNAGQAAVFVLARAVDRKSPDYYPLSIANAVYGGGSNGRLFQEVRAKRGLSYGANSSISARVDAGLLAAAAQTKNETAAEVARLIMSELARLGGEPIPADAIDKRKAFLLGGFGRQIETSNGLSNYLASLVQYGLPLSEIQTYPTSLMAATPETINAAVARDLPAGQASILVVGDAKLFGEDLRKTWPNAEFIPAAEVDLDSPTLRKR